MFCEKPLCLSEDELGSIVRAYLGIASAQRPALMVGFNRRFAPMVVQMKSFLAPISEPCRLHYRINAGYLPPDHWVNDREQGGGRILGEVCHFVDLLMFLAASPIVEVEGRAPGNSRTLQRRQRSRLDSLCQRLRRNNQLSGERGPIVFQGAIEVFGGGAVAVLEDFRRLELVREGRKRTIHSRWRQDKGHRSEWAAFARIRTEGD